jgi:hypothetical protein
MTVCDVVSVSAAVCTQMVLKVSIFYLVGVLHMHVSFLCTYNVLHYHAIRHTAVMNKL